MDPIVVVARRNGVVEARHLVHAVAVRNGAVVAEAGDGGLVCFMRSASKPLQALPLARAREDLDTRDLAIASASHRASDEQLEAVRRLLEKAPADEDELEVGLQDCRPPTKLHHNCSGKHAGMLALCRARGWDATGYRLAGHPVQDACLAVHADAAAVGADELPTAVDGCGVVTYALPLERMAYAYSRLRLLDRGGRVADAMRAHPDLVGGPGSADTEVMRALPGWIAKGGAEGLLCAAGPDGTGVALKAADGAWRAIAPAAAQFFGRLGLAVDTLRAVPVENSRREVVGEISVDRPGNDV
jgi:L-asparaginase II